MNILLYWTMPYGPEYWKTWYGILRNLITLRKVPDDQIISGYFRASVLSETPGQTMNRIRRQAVTMFRRNCRGLMRNIWMPTPVLLEWFDFCTLFAVIHVVTGPFIYVYDKAGIRSSIYCTNIAGKRITERHFEPFSKGGLTSRVTRLDSSFGKLGSLEK